MHIDTRSMDLCILCLRGHTPKFLNVPEDCFLSDWTVPILMKCINMQHFILVLSVWRKVPDYEYWSINVPPKICSRGHFHLFFVAALRNHAGRQFSWMYQEIYHTLQLIHSFEINIRICHSSKVHHLGFAEVDITFEGWQILMKTEKECVNCFFIWLFRLYFLELKLAVVR